MDFQADLSLLNSIIEFIRSPLEKKNISAQEMMRIELAAEEAIVNVISYAYPQKKGNETVNVEVSEPVFGQFSIQIKDKGIAFNPSEIAINPKVDRPLEERNIGGLGLFLMRKLVDEISYKRVKDENVLIMTFRLKP